MNVFAEENDMRLRMHHWKENGKPKMIQPKRDGPDPVGIAVVLILLVCAILVAAPKCNGQTVHYPLPTVLEDCEDILDPCDSLGLALCLYPVNPGFGMAGVALIPSGGVCSEDGAVLSNGATLTAMVVPFGAQAIEYILVDGEGDYQWETNQGGSPPFVITEPLILTVMGTGQARITSIRIVGGVVTGLAPQSAQYVNYPPKPRVYYDSDGRLHPYRLKRRR